MYARCPIKVNLKYPTILVGVFHLTYLIFRIYEITMEIIYLEEVIEYNQLTYLFLLVLLQLGIIISLFVGACRSQHLCLLPWLCFTAPIFCMATIYSSLYAANGEITQIVINYVFIVLFWFAWYIVFRNYLTLKNAFSYSPIKSYTYSGGTLEIIKEPL